MGDVRTGLRAVLLAVCLAALAVCLAAGAASARTFGVYKGNGCTGAAALPGFVAWDGHKVTRVLDFLNFASWPALLSDLPWTIDCWHKAGAPTLTLSVPMLVADGTSTLAKGAAGAYTQNFTQIASSLVKAGYGTAVIRLGWEFNGGWYPWTPGKDPASFIKYWRVIVAAMRGVPGAHFQFDWCTSDGMNSVAPNTVYPGDDVVDVIGMDLYNSWWTVANKTPATRWAYYLTEPYGLNWLRAFAGLHGKPISIPEWGTGTRPNGHGGGDDPLFVTNLINWMAANSVVYNDYWDYHASDYNAELSNGQFPQAGAALKAGAAKLAGGT